jgi:hypothetical protein
VDIGVRSGVIAILIHEEDCVEDLHRSVRIHGSGDLGDAAKVVVNEFAKAGVVFHGAASAATANEELKIWNAERVLHVDHQQPGFV